MFICAGGGRNPPSESVCRVLSKHLYVSQGRPQQSGSRRNVRNYVSALAGVQVGMGEASAAGLR
jgi:hypothetical protein